MRHYRLLVLAVAACLLLPMAAAAPTAQQSADQAKALLAKGDLEGALQAYQAAARADESHLQQFAVVRQALEIRRQLETEQDPERWEYLGRALHSFYLRNGLYAQALDLATKMHQRLRSETSAVVVAETAFAINKNDIAAQALSSLDAAQTSPATQALLGVALSRQGKPHEARQIAQKVRPADDSAPPAVYAIARLQAATGNTKAALASLERVFQSLPPSRQESYKDHARQCPEFSGLVSTAAFAKVLQTESKVPESKCSGGSSCAGCPMRGKCQHGEQ